MPNANQILPFATGGGADVLSPADYAALPGRSSGLGTGTAISTHFNTIWRQASFVAAMIAQFTADYGPSDVDDNGDVAGFETLFIDALRAFYPPAASLLHYGVAGGTANALTSTVTPTITALGTGGMTFLIKATADNTGAATFNPSGIGVENIKRPDGSALQYGDIENGAVCILIWDGTNMQLAGSMLLSDDLIHYGADSSGAANTVTVATFDPPLYAYKPGITLLIKIANTNTGSTTVNGKSVKRPDGTSLVGGELVIGSVATFVYDGTQLFLQTAQATNTNTSTGGLTAVATDAPIHGDGTSGNHVAIYQATTSVSGANQLAAQSDFEANPGTSRSLTPDAVWAAAAFQTVAYGATVTLDFSTGFNFSIGALTGDITLANPTNVKSGQEGLITLPQDGTGGRALTLGTHWITPGGNPGLSTPPSAVDAIAYKVVSSTQIVYSMLKGLTQ